METRASYVAVGLFIIVLAVGAAGFTIWLGNISLDRSVVRYVINFSDSVSGLTEGSAVRYQGVPVGNVSDIRINPDDPQEIQTFIEIEPDLPIKTDSYAQLQLAGITGQQYIEITGGTAGADPLPVPPEGVPEIPSRPSTFAAITDELPNIIEQVNTALTRLNNALSEDNVAALNTTLDNISSISSTANDLVTDTREEMLALVRNAGGFVEEARIDLARLSDGANQVLVTANQEVSEAGDAVQAATQTITSSAEAFSGVASQTSQLVAGARPGLIDFSQYGLFEFTLLIEELRQLARNFNRIIDQIERNPTEFFFGDTSSGIRVD